jgi:hypothetical protein
METATTTAIQVDLQELFGRRAKQDGRTAGSFLTAAIRLSYWACFAMCALLLCKPTYAQDRSEFWPEFDTYVNLSSRTRLFFVAALSGDQDTKNVQGEFGPNIDFFVRPFARARLRDADPSKSKLLTFRVGYRYLPTLRGTGGTENRGVVEMTPRFNLPLDILLSDRNRVDLRGIRGQDFSWRYRNRITLERNFVIKTYVFTPYLRGEFFYDSRYEKIAKNAFTVGSVFPLTKHTEFEVYYEDQRDSSTSPNFHIRGAGLVLSLYF